LVFAIRRCCICGYCTEACPEGIPARKVFAALREALSTAGVTGEEGFETTQVDKEWHIFSVYRAVHGIAYADLPHVQQASEQGIDTLFFPGCPLLSYAPELTREVFAWLEGHGFKAAITEDCCGSPLKTAGFGDRYRAHKQRLAEAIAQAGIRRVIGVCPACLQELASAEGFPATVELLGLPQVLQQAGVTISTSALEGSPAAVFDSCADRSGAFGKPLRALFEPDVLREMGHAGSNARCCGAGGATVLVDPAIGARRAQAAIDEARATAPVLVSNCPTCAYTFAYHAKGLEAGFAPCSGQVGADALPSLRHCHYLELIFKNRFDWDKVFEQLEGMWTGEYGAWVNWVFSGQEGRE
jgi:Fe-S oxidoreductase